MEDATAGMTTAASEAMLDEKPAAPAVAVAPAVASASGGYEHDYEEKKEESSTTSSAAAIIPAQHYRANESSAGPKDATEDEGGSGGDGGGGESGSDTSAPAATATATTTSSAAAARNDSGEDGDNESSSSSEEESSSSDDDSSDNDDGEDNNVNNGLSEYERLRLQRIERNKARLAQLGLAGDTIAKRSGHGKNRKKREKPKEEDLVATRNQPKRSVKTGLTHEQLHGPDVRQIKEVQTKLPKKPRKEKYIPGTCFKCKAVDGERIYCAYCGFQYHPDCHVPKVEMPLPGGRLFRCATCEDEGKTRRIACGVCEPCNRMDDCGSCAYCIDKMQHGGDGVKRKKCVMRKCITMFDIQPKLSAKTKTTSTPSPKKATHGDQDLMRSEGDGTSQPKQDESAPANMKTDIGAEGGDDDEHEGLCFNCRDGGVLICCDDCDRVYHSACHKPMIFNVYAKLHCQECKREEKQRALEMKMQRDKERRIRRRLASGALAGIVDDETIFVKVVGPTPCCVVCNVSRNEFKPLPLPPAKRVLYASQERGKKQIECVVKWPHDTFKDATTKHAESIASKIEQNNASKVEEQDGAEDDAKGAEDKLKISERIKVQEEAAKRPQTSVEDKQKEAKHIAAEEEAAKVSQPSASPPTDSSATAKAKLTSGGRPACEVVGCTKASQGKKFGFMCIYHFKLTNGEVVKPRIRNSTTVASPSKAVESPPVAPVAEAPVQSTKAAAGAAAAAASPSPGSSSLGKGTVAHRKAEKETESKGAKRKPEKSSGGSKNNDNGSAKGVAGIGKQEEKSGGDESNHKEGSEDKHDTPADTSTSIDKYADEPILDAIVIDEDGDDFEVKCAIKWPHENPDAKYGDDMIYCNTCGDWYHLHCCSPPVVHRDKGGPRGNWQCKGCKKHKRSKPQKKPKKSQQQLVSAHNPAGVTKLPGTAHRCGECEACKRKDCGECKYCLDKPKFGGNHRLRQTCQLRRCKVFGTPIKQPTRKLRCGECLACKRDDCGKCKYCLDKPKFGGTHKKRKPCELKICTNPRDAQIKCSSPVPPSSSACTLPSSAAQAEGGVQYKKSDDEDNDNGVSSSVATPGDNVDIRFSSGGGYRSVKSCKVEGCEKNSRGNKFDGMCQVHFNVAYPDVAAMGPIYVKLCKVLGCERNARGKLKWDGMCMHHHNERCRGVVHEFKEATERAKPGKKSRIDSMDSDEISKRDEALEKSRKKQEEAQQKNAARVEAKSKMSEKKKGKKRGREEDEGDDGNEKINASASDAEGIKPKRRSRKRKKGEQSAPPKKKKEKAELDPISKKIDKIIKSAIKNPDDAKKQDLACEGLRKYARDPDNAVKIFQLGGLAMIIAAMKGHPDKALVQAEAIGTLADLVWVNSNNGEQILAEGCVDLITKAMKRLGTHPMVNKMGCGFFRTCSYDPDIAEQIKDSGTAAVIASMKRNPRKVEVLREGCVFLQNIIFVSPELARTILRMKRGESEEDAVVPKLVEAMQNNPKNTKLHQAICGVLSNVALNERGKFAIAKSGAIPIVMSILPQAKADDVELKQSILSVLKHLAMNDNANRESITQAGGIDSIISVMKEDPKDVVLLTVACGLLKELALHDKGNAMEITSKGAVKLIVAAMDKHGDFDQMQAAACAVLGEIKHDGSKTTVAAARRVIWAMENFDVSYVQEEACHALYNLATSTNVLPLLKTRDVHHVLNAAKEDYPDECEAIVDELLAITTLRSSR